LGAEGSVAAGPVGRTATAQTDAQLHADILSRSRSQGLFAGLALEVAHRALPSRRRGEKSRQTGRKLPGLLAAARPWGR
jgi:lipid-binding SYLF domain-containing protein